MKCWKSLLMVTRVSHCVVEHVRNSTDWQSNKGLSHPGWTSTVCSLLSSSALLCCAVLVHHSGDFPVKSKLCISCVNYVAYRIYRYLYHEIIWYKERQGSSASCGRERRREPGKHDHPGQVLHVRQNRRQQVGSLSRPPAGGVYGRRRPGCPWFEEILLPQNAPSPRGSD